MITVSAFFSESLATVDSVIGNFVSIAYTNFLQANAGMITLLFTVYIMMLGYRFLIHDVKTDMNDLVRHLILLSCVFGMLMSWRLYNVFVYNIFTNEPGNIAQVLVNSAGSVQSGTNIAHALDAIYSAVMNATMGFLGQVSFSATGIAFVFYGMLVFVIGTLLCVFALLLFIYAKMVMAVALALGPVFILFLLWDSTKGMFSAWLNKLITTALIPIVTSAILVLMLSVINVTLPKINQPAESMQFYGIAPFLGLSLATTLILSQVLRICSSLGGGIALSGLSQGLNIAKSSLQATGITAASQAATSWAKNKISPVKKHIVRRRYE